MGIYRGTYYSAWSCSGFARPGAKALMSWYLGAYKSRGAANLGIYVCKRLGSGYSIHGDGRACDLGTAPYNSPGGSWPDWGWALANALRLNSAELGIQLIIFRGKVWSCRYPDSGWRNYSGSDPHNGHMHVELTPSAAKSLTVAKIQSRIGGASPSLPSTGSTLREGDTGPAVERLQRDLNEAIGAGLTVDGDFGPATAAAVKTLQRRAGITQDGIYGSESARALTALLEEDDMDLDDKIGLRWDGEVRYSAKTTTVGGILTSTNYYTLQARDKLLAEMSAAKKREEAILAAVKGVDTKSILAAIERAAVEDAARDTAAADALAEIAALVAKVGSGEIAADQVVDAIADRLSRVE